jgi:hypothetical protein
MNEIDRVVRAGVFELLVAGSHHVTPAEVSVSTALPEGVIVESFGRLADEHRVVLSGDRNQVVMAHPFSARSTEYRAEIGDRFWWANCAWDAFGILALLGDGRAVASPRGRSETVWTVRDGVVEPGGIVHFVVPAARFWDDIGFT